MKKTKVWGGRFEGATSPLMESFSRSITVDRLMWRQDIAVNKAWARALAEIGIYSASELQVVLVGLAKIDEEFDNGHFDFQSQDEDIHVAIERRLTELAGAAGARIHTGRSRNDQVATDARLYLKTRSRDWAAALLSLQEGLLALAEQHREIVLPGYTHWQQAQPILLAHYVLAIFWGVDRTLARLADYFPRLDVLPLGSGALAGSAFPVDRAALAQELGFSAVSANSIDATGDRDFCAELLFIIGAFFTLLSRVCGELQMWSAPEFGFVEFSDAFATGSSMMPQKKNPDAMELIRGKTAAAIAASNQMLMLQKGLPLTYNRDLQEDKAVVFRQLDEVIIATEIFREALITVRFNTVRMLAAIDPLSLATDVADYLVRKGLPFRHAHEISGQIVRRALAEKTTFAEIPLAVYKEYSELFADDIYASMTIVASLAQRSVIGGTAPEAVIEQFSQAHSTIRGYTEHPFLTKSTFAT